MIDLKGSAFVLAAFLLGGVLPGWCCMGMIGEMEPPADGVQVKIEQALSDEQNDVVQSKLNTLAGDSLGTSSMVINGRATFNISPVADAQAFADQIDFGTVKSIEGRVIHLEVDEDAL